MKYMHRECICSRREAGAWVPILNFIKYWYLPHIARSAKCSIAIVNRPSVRPSVSVSVTLKYHGRIGWVTSKVITRIISLGSSLLGAQHRRSRFSRKLAIFLKRCKIWPRLLLMTNRTLHTRFQLAPKPTTLDDLERPLRILFQNTCVLVGHHKTLNEDRPRLSAAKM